jgi:endonuclease-3
MPKKPYDIDEMVERIREAVKPYPKAAMFQLAEEGFSSPFEQLVACMISIRTLDEVSLPTARKLFSRARTPEAIARLSPPEIDVLIRASSFHERKAEQIQALAQRVLVEFGGELPCDVEVMMSFSGVGLNCEPRGRVACGQMRWRDIHVHRTPLGLCPHHRSGRPARCWRKLLQKYWVEINRIWCPLEDICTGACRCSTCRSGLLPASRGGSAPVNGPNLQST